MRIILILLGWFFVGLGMIGVVIPGLPTVPFLIVALICFSKSSKRFYDWLYGHNIFGPQLKLWSKYQVIPPIAKITAITSMIISLTFIAIFLDWPVIALVFLALTMLGGGLYILSKPSYPPQS